MSTETRKVLAMYGAVLLVVSAVSYMLYQVGQWLAPLIDALKAMPWILQRWEIADVIQHREFLKRRVWVRQRVTPCRRFPNQIPTVR